jgi:hypothetical protein
MEDAQLNNYAPKKQVGVRERTCLSASLSVVPTNLTQSSKRLVNCNNGSLQVL